MVEAVEVRDKQSVLWQGDAHGAGMLCPALGMLQGSTGSSAPSRLLHMLPKPGAGFV